MILYLSDKKQKCSWCIIVYRNISLREVTRTCRLQASLTRLRGVHAADSRKISRADSILTCIYDARLQPHCYNFISRNSKTSFCASAAPCERAHRWLCLAYAADSQTEFESHFDMTPAYLIVAMHN